MYNESCIWVGTIRTNLPYKGTAAGWKALFWRELYFQMTSEQATRRRAKPNRSAFDIRTIIQNFHITVEQEPYFPFLTKTHFY
jgi:hypothetical protein